MYVLKTERRGKENGDGIQRKHTTVGGNTCGYPTTHEPRKMGTVVLPNRNGQRDWGIRGERTYPQTHRQLMEEDRGGDGAGDIFIHELRDELELEWSFGMESVWDASAAL